MEVINKKELCIVHIGMPKTGSSTLQETFFSGIADPRVSYGSLPHPNQSGWLYSLFTKRHKGYHFLIGWQINEPEKLEQFISESKRALIDGFIGKKNSIELLSGEDLFHLEESGIRELKLFLDTYFEKTIIVAYVRPLKSFLESVFQQRVKYHDCGSFSAAQMYHPFKNLKRYDDIFGVENVLLWKFQPDMFPEGDIVLDFCNRLQFQPMKSINKVVNDSISKEAISILFAYNFYQSERKDFGAAQVKVNYLLVDALRSIGCEKFRFSNSLVCKVIEDYSEDYEWMSRRLVGFDIESKSCSDDEGFSSADELLDYSTNFIGTLLGLVDTRHMDFAFVKHPLMVAKLVNLLAVQLYRGLPA